MKYLLYFTSFLLIFSCAEQSETKNENTNKEETQNEEVHHHDEEGIQLNEGQKWRVDDSMLIYIQEIESLVMNFEIGHMESVNLLSDSLREKIDLLTSNCTMKGQAHDELHKWLMPFIGMVGELEESANLEQSKSIHLRLKESFSEFNTYFE